MGHYVQVNELVARQAPQIGDLGSLVRLTQSLYLCPITVELFDALRARYPQVPDGTMSSMQLDWAGIVLIAGGRSDFPAQSARPGGEHAL